MSAGSALKIAGSGTAPPSGRSEVAKLRREVAAESLRLERDVLATKRNLLLSTSGDYAGAKRNRLREGPAASTTSADAQLDGWTLDRLRAESQRLMRNSPIARAMVKRLVDRTVGSGMTLQCTTASREWNEEAEEAFNTWAMQYCDARGMNSHGSMQALVLESMIVDGDCGLVETKGLGEGPEDVLRLQCIEAQRIASGIRGSLADSAGTDKPVTVQGVHLNAAGRPVAFDIATYAAGGTALATTYTTVKAEDFIYVCPIRRMSQTRGEPRLAALINLSEAMNQYIGATVQAARVGACQAMLIKTTNPADLQSEILGETTTTEDGQSQKIDRIEPGMVRYMGVGEDVVSFKPEQPTTQFSDFSRMLMRIMGTDMDLPLEMVLLDHSQSTAYAGRAALATVKAAVDRVRDFLKRVMLCRNYKRVIGALIANGTLPFVEDWECHHWVPPASPSFEPDKDIAAAILRVNNNFSTLEYELSESGRDLETTLEQRSREKKMQEAMGVTPPSMPGSQTGSPAATEDSGEEDAAAMEDDSAEDAADTEDQNAPRAPGPTPAEPSEAST